MSKRTAADFIKEKKKIILVILLIALLAITVYLFYGDSGGDTAATQTNMTETETKLAAILSSMDGVGEVEVLVTESDDGITGIVVVCEGADSILVRNNILNAVATALNINKNIIAIYSM